MKKNNTFGALPLELNQVCTGLHETIEATLQSCSFVADVHLLLQQEIDILLILKHLQHLPLQLDSRLLQHLEADHQWDLVSQTLVGNLREKREKCFQTNN